MATEYEIEEWWCEFLRAVTPEEDEEEAKKVYGINSEGEEE